MPASQRCRRRCARSASTRTSTSACRSTRTFRDEAGRDGPPRRLLRHAAGRAGVRLLRLPDAVHAGAERPGERARRAVARTRARTSRSSPSASTRATRRRSAAAKKADYLERYKRPGAAAGWHFLTGDQPSIDRADEGGRLPLRLGRRRRSSSRTRPASSSLTPDGRLVALPLRHRVRPARSAARARRGVGRQGRHAGRRAAALLLSLRPDDRPLRPRDHARAAHRRRRHRPRASARSSSSWCAASGAGSRAPAHPRTSHLDEAPLAMWSGTPLFPEAGVDDGRPRRRAVLLPARGLASSSRS